MNSKNIQIETERKFLIKTPDIHSLTAKHSYVKKEIIQTYLNSSAGSTKRVRKITVGSDTSFVFTEKTRINALSCYENEHEISEKEYTILLRDKNIRLNQIVKTRFCIPFNNHTVEIDIYPFWNDRAILEVELKSEDELFDLPPEIRVIKEVTNDRRYKNVSLAKEIPFDKIL